MKTHAQENADKRSVLIVEDEYLIALDLADTMRKLGFRVIGPALRSTEAQALARDCDPGFAIVDLNLGAADSGERLLATLNGRGVRCVVLSAMHDACERVRKRTPEIAVIDKPASMERVVNAMRELESGRKGCEVVPPVG